MIQIKDTRINPNEIVAYYPKYSSNNFKGKIIIVILKNGEKIEIGNIETNEEVNFELAYLDKATR